MGSHDVMSSHLQIQLFQAAMLSQLTCCGVLLHVVRGALPRL